MFTAGLFRSACSLICIPPRPGTSPGQVGSTVGRFLLTLRWGVSFFALTSFVRGLPFFPWGCSRYLTALLCQSFLACSLLVSDLLPFSWEFVALLSAHSFSHFFVLLLTAFLTALSFSVLSRLGRLFCRPACFYSLRGQAVVSPAFLPPCLWRLHDGWVTASFPRPSCSRQVAPLAALCVGRLPGRSLCRLLGRSARQFLGRSVGLLLDRAVCRLLSRLACRFLGRSVCRLLRRSACRLLRRSVCLLPRRSV